MDPRSPLRDRLWLLLSLYICQGLPTGVFNQALPALLRRYDVPLTVIGFSGLLALPWALKFLWAPLVERHFSPRWGRHRSWILPLQLAAFLLLLAIAAFDPRQLAEPGGMPVFFLLMFLVNLVAATQDIATDGLAVRSLGFGERGLGNGVQVAGYRIGLVIGGGLLLYVIGDWGWRTAFWGLAGLLLLLSWPVWRYRESPPAAQALASASALGAHHRPYLQIFTSFFARPGLRGWLLVLATYKAGESLGSAMVKPMLVDMGLDLRQIGLMVSLVGSLATLAGAFLGGWLTALLGRYPAIIGFGLLQALTVGLYAAVPWLHDSGREVPLELVYSINAVEHFVSGMAMAALLTAVMDLARVEHAAADFTVQVSLLAIFGGGVTLLAGVAAKALGYTAYFLLSAGLALLLLGPAALVCRRLPWLLPGGLTVAPFSGDDVSGGGSAGGDASGGSVSGGGVSGDNARP